MTGSVEQSPKLSIITPAYNEAASLRLLVDRIRDVLCERISYELIIVNDGSQDGTSQVLTELAEENAHLRYITFSKNYGHQAALKAGIHHARGACIIALDADLQQPPELIPEMIAKWRQGAKIVFTKREEGQTQSLFKRVSSSIYYMMINLIGDMKLQSGAADFYLLDRQVVDALLKFSERRWFLRGLLPTLGFETATLNYTPAKRAFGSSRYTLRKMLVLAVDGILSTSIAPLRLGIVLASVVGSLALVYAVYALYVSMFTSTALPGWTSVLMTVAIIGAMQLFLLGVIGEYLGRTLLEVRQRPDYIIADSNIRPLNESTSQADLTRKIAQ